MNTIDEVYESYGSQILRYATVLVGPDDAADLVSDVVAAAISDRRWTRADAPIAYLQRSLLNAARTRYRSEGRRRAREMKSFHRGRQDDASSSTPLLSNPDILKAVSDLSPQQRAVIYFTYWEDQRPAETAAILGIGEGSVKKHLARARKQLKEVLHEYQH